MFNDERPISAKWFAEATPVNYTLAKATLGSGDNGTITVTADGIATDVVIKIVVAETASADMTAALADGTMTITLGTTADVTPTADSTKNTAALIAEAISGVEGFTAVASGTGETAIAEATTVDVAFTAGNNGTPCFEKGVILKGDSYYYISTKADNTIYNDGWRRFTLSDY